MGAGWQRRAGALLLAFVAACGGGDQAPAVLPAAPTLNLALALKEFRFTWAAASGATFYRLFENPDGVAGFSQIGGDLTALGFNHAIALYRRASASYRLDACNSAGCTASAGVTPGAGLAQAIGYVKSSSPGLGDTFGNAVALSADGTTLAVGAEFEDSGTSGVNSSPDEAGANSGAVYVFSLSSGVWSQQAYVKASNTGSNDQFGRALALSADGNTLVIGAWNEDGGATGVNGSPNEATTDSGAVYVFTRSGGVWSQQAYVKASNTGAGDQFGSSVALSGDGDTLAVGARREDSGTTGVNSNPDEAATDSGAVYVFTRSGSVWSQQAYLKASNTGDGDAFGAAVALSGNGSTLAVGAQFEDSSTTGVNSTPNESAALAGAVYVFSRNADAWSQEAYVKSSGTQAVDLFGASVALSADGNTLAVGAQGDDNILLDSGAAYVFTRSGTAWSQQARIKASNLGFDDRFGISVALSADGNTLAIGAEFEDGSASGVNRAPDEAAVHSGAVYVFIRSAGVWSQQAYLKASNTDPDDLFGGAVALSADGNTLAVGALFEDSSSAGVGSNPNESASLAGAVYLY